VLLRAALLYRAPSTLRSLSRHTCAHTFRVPIPTMTAHRAWATHAAIAAMCLLFASTAVANITPSPCNPDPCVHGQCLSLPGAALCLCEPEFTGPLCNISIACGTNPCLNGGSCSPGSPWNANFVCTCPLGFIGATCESTIVACTNNTCQNGATCLSDGTDDICICPAGFEGDQCENANIAECNSMPCLNGGTCNHMPNSNLGYFCDCDVGFHGADCELIDPLHCESSPCSNGGSCIPYVQNSNNRRAPQSSGFLCHCPVGYTGEFCDEEVTNPCASVPCMYGGTCKPTAIRPQVRSVDDPNYSFVCFCPAPLTGQFCETAPDPCLSSPCSNGGTCVPDFTDLLSATFTCQCPAKFTHSLCEHPLDELVLDFTVDIFANVTRDNEVGATERVEVFIPANATVGVTNFTFLIVYRPIGVDEITQPPPLTVGGVNVGNGNRSVIIAGPYAMRPRGHVFDRPITVRFFITIPGGFLSNMTYAVFRLLVRVSMCVCVCFCADICRLPRTVTYARFAAAKFASIRR
jgi:hypothetical protein